MRRVLVIAFLMLGQQLASQTQLNGLIEVPQTFSMNFSNSRVYSKTDLHLGLKFNTNQRSNSVYGVLQFCGDLFAYNDDRKNYEINYLAIGGGANYRVNSPNKKFSPLIKMEVMTEIYSNYTGHYIRYDLWPQNYVDEYWNGSTHLYYNYYYVSTPWISTIAFGFDYKLFKGLSLNATVGYGIRLVKIRLQSIHTSETDPDLSVGIDLSEKYKLKDFIWCSLLDVHAGLSYSFPFKKKE